MSTVAEDTGVQKFSYPADAKYQSREWSGKPIGQKGARKVWKNDYVRADGAIVLEFYFRSETDNFRAYDFDPATEMKSEEDVGTTLIVAAARHGLSQKLGDELAGTEDMDDMKADLDALASRLQEGNWTAERTGGQAGTGILYKALVELKQAQVPGITEAEARTAVQAFLAKKTADEKEALKRNGPAALMAIITRLEAEKAAAAPKIDTAQLMQGL